MRPRTTSGASSAKTSPASEVLLRGPAEQVEDEPYRRPAAGRVVVQPGEEAFVLEIDLHGQRHGERVHLEARQGEEALEADGGVGVGQVCPAFLVFLTHPQPGSARRVPEMMIDLGLADVERAVGIVRGIAGQRGAGDPHRGGQQLIQPSEGGQRRPAPRPRDTHW